MALQGSIDTFAIADVLRLLAATAKTGELRVEADRCRAEVVVVDGAVTAVAVLDIDRAPVPVDEELFELLGCERGQFRFTADPAVRPDGPVEAHDVDELLERVEALRTEWEEVRAVVPSPQAWLALRPEMPGDRVTMSAADWRSVMAVGPGSTVGDLARHLAASELGVGRQVRELVALGVLDVVPEGPPGRAPGGAVAPWGAASGATVGAEVGGGAMAGKVEAGGVEGGGNEHGPAPDGVGDNGGEVVDVARRLARLDPTIARAVAAAAAAAPAERERLLADVERRSGLDHELLARFLGVDR